jgi:hypothetical protein
MGRAHSYTSDRPTVKPAAAQRHGPEQLPPGNLSGSGSEAHQHFSPADANCCYSLLLDPDATIGIDLHKWLFLLVSGRGE